MSKAARIRELYAQGKTTREIAQAVGCRIEYVRVCARQRTETGGDSAHDKRWKTTNAFKKWRRDHARARYHGDPLFRQRTLDRSNRYQARKREGAAA